MFILTPQKRKAFGDILRKNRIEKGYNLQQVAKFIDYPFGLLAYLERGQETKIRMEIIERLCDLYSLDKDSICISLGKIPTELFYKIIKHPEILAIIRNYKA